MSAQTAVAPPVRSEDGVVDADGSGEGDVVRDGSETGDAAPDDVTLDDVTPDGSAPDDATPEDATPAGPAGEPTFADVLRLAIEARGLALDRIRQHLSAAGFELTNATLSYWQSGRSEPGRADSRRAVGELERILRTEPGFLTARLAPPRSRGRKQPAPVIEPRETVSSGHWERFAGEALPLLERVKIMTTHDQMAVGPDRRPTRHLLRETMRALVEGVELYPVLWEPDRPDEVNPSATALSGCSLQRLEVVPDEHIMLAVFAFPGPLRRNEVAMIAYDVRTEVPEVDALLHSVVAPVKELMVGVQFHPDALPHKVYRVVSAGRSRVVTEVEIRPDATVQAFEFDFGPGELGLTWVWDPPEDSAPLR